MSWGMRAKGHFQRKLSAEAPVRVGGGMTCVQGTGLLAEAVGGKGHRDGSWRSAWRRLLCRWEGG